MVELDSELVSSTIDRMIEEKSIISDPNNSIYLPPFYFSETGTANRIKEILAARSMFRPADADAIIRQVQREHGGIGICGIWDILQAGTCHNYLTELSCADGISCIYSGQIGPSLENPT